MSEGQGVRSWIVNALIPDAEPRAAFVREFDPMGRSRFRAAMNGLRRLQGGLWVGGRLHAGEDRIVFVPNALNTAANDGEISLSVPFDQITRVQRRFGILTGIVDVATRSGVTYSFRAFGANRLAQALTDRLGV